MRRGFVKAGLPRLIFTFITLLMSLAWSSTSEFNMFEEYPACRLTTLLQTVDMQGKSLTVCAAMCSRVSGCATFSYHGDSYMCELSARDAFSEGCSDTADTAGWRTFGRKDDTIYSPCVHDEHCFEANTRCLQIQSDRAFYCRCLAMFEYSAVSKGCERACSAYGTTWPTSYSKIENTFIFKWQYFAQHSTPPDACAEFCNQSADCESFCVKNTTDNLYCYLKKISAPEANRSGHFRTDTAWETYMRLCA